MFSIQIYKGWILYRAEIYMNDTQVEIFYGLTKRGAVRRAQSYLDMISNPTKGYVETMWYNPLDK